MAASLDSTTMGRRPMSGGSHHPRIMGGDIRIDPVGFDIGISNSGKKAIASVEAAGGTPYPIPAGASDRRLGGLGFANMAVELAAQEADLDTFFGTVIVCTVTGSSHTGMIAGFALEHRDDRRVIGIDASAELDKTIDQVMRIATNTADSIELGRPLRDDEITVIAGYEGKSMAGLIAMVRSGEIPAGRRSCPATSVASRVWRRTPVHPASAESVGSSGGRGGSRRRLHPGEWNSGRESWSTCGATGSWRQR